MLARSRGMTKLLTLALALALAGPAAADDSMYCVERDASYMLGVEVHPDLRRCVPAP